MAGDALSDAVGQLTRKSVNPEIRAARYGKEMTPDKGREFRSKDSSQLTWLDTQHLTLTGCDARQCGEFLKGGTMHCNPITIDEFDSQRLGCSRQRS
jgi:hypothetical protein